MKAHRILVGAAIVAALALVNRAEAQMMYGGSLRYGSSIGYAAGPFGGSVASIRGPFGGSVTSARGPLGGSVTVAQDPFGGGAVGVRGPFGGAAVVRSSVFSVPPVAPVAPVTVVRQIVLNPARPALPYTAAYMARIPPGYPPLEIGGMSYLYTPVLPLGAQLSTVGGATYYVSNGVTYQPYFLGMQTVYLVVEL